MRIIKLMPQANEDLEGIWVLLAITISANPPSDRYVNIFGRSPDSE